MKKTIYKSLVLVSTLALASCGTASEPAWKRAVAGDGPGQPSDVDLTAFEVRNLPKSRTGNSPEYEVFGIRYAVLDSARGFREQGTASWYGAKFHGNATSSGEIYDMHRLTAAHKHLPLPTFVRVTRVDNGHSIVVKVNDRGPFVGDRIIDLSYAAALSLDMLDNGKTDVVIEALSDHGKSINSSRYIQVGAFADAMNAEKLMRKVSFNVPVPAKLDFEAHRRVYRVQLGPLQDDSAVSRTLKQLESVGIEGYAIRKVMH